MDGTEYLNVAAEIAHEETNDPLMRIVIWRDYQFQLIYHLLQVNSYGVKFLQLETCTNQFFIFYYMRMVVDQKIQYKFYWKKYFLIQLESV